MQQVLITSIVLGVFGCLLVFVYSVSGVVVLKLGIRSVRVCVSILSNHVMHSGHKMQAKMHLSIDKRIFGGLLLHRTI